MAVTVRRPNSICIFGGRREKPGKRCKVKKYRTQRRFSVRAKDRGSRALWHRGDGDPEPVHLEEIDTTFAIEWKGQFASTAQPSSPPIQAPAAAPPSSATQRKRSLKQADLKLSDIFG